jgi:L-fuconolactonase
MTIADATRDAVVDAHVHFWNPRALSYPWLTAFKRLMRPFLPEDYAAATEHAGIERIVFVECNCEPTQNLREVELVERLAEAEDRIAAMVAYADLTSSTTLDRSLDELQRLPRVRGIRHNIQGEPPGFCLQSAFLDGVREIGRRGLTFDLCATHDQLPDVVELARRCPDTRLVLDHCGKPAIRDELLDPWRSCIDQLAECENVWCKLSGLLTEADPTAWQHVDLMPYAEHVVDRFGIGRTMYGSDWPVLTLAGSYGDWLDFTRRLTAAWSATERQLFYGDNAASFYSL